MYNVLVHKTFPCALYVCYVRVVYICILCSTSMEKRKRRKTVGILYIYTVVGWSCVVSVLPTNSAIRMITRFGRGQ